MNIKSAVVKKPNVLVKGFSLSVQLPYRSHIDSMSSSISGMLSD